ncbi:uncharacterized protein MELLADRAFT_94758 [Melampsora larici-populina 98AG31]|uniref:Uncharacterized protein n=1 Tax=Melampsora larici-populina (strain 98AG31 / pathotype 3-4-7) TaxID=747676 RepID=F4S7T9_MELLP|nr:uncharacterized protein MELLADRAFT_94758 [Melampsora larici-populina 98AG31]EGF99269.1 hypothetical protein MELLADRAFT_94758 [Melampsora larici-populina 98AG31]
MMTAICSSLDPLRQKNNNRFARSSNPKLLNCAHYRKLARNVTDAGWRTRLEVKTSTATVVPKPFGLMVAVLDQQQLTGPPTCKNKTGGLKKTTDLTSFFGRLVTSRNMNTISCPGLNDVTWERERATHSIADFISKTCTLYRGNNRHKICKELFGSQAQESQLTAEQKSHLITTLDARSKWEVKRHGERSSIYSSNCERTFICKNTEKNAVCPACEELKGLRSLIGALNKDYAEKDKLKFTRDTYLSDNINTFSPTLLKSTDARLLSNSVEKASKGDFSDFCTVLAASARNGLFDNRDATRGLIKAVAVKAARENAGKTTRAISPRALNLFNDNFAGRGNRSLRMKRAKDGMHLVDGLQIVNFNCIAQVLKDLGYSGPVAAASDQTVCVKRLRHHDGHLVGAQGGDISFDDPSELPALVKSVVKNKELCSKIRAYTLQVPLPNIPTFVVALIASCDKETSNDIVESHLKFLELSQEAGINILSVGADGAPTELCAQNALTDTASQFISYSNSRYDVHVKVPLIGHPPRPVVMVQDPKHARKTGANQLSSGACLLVMVGEMCDAWLNRWIGHRERIRSAWTADFFFRHWKNYLLKQQAEPHKLMSFAHNCISPQSFKIFSTLATSLLQLVIAHREFYPTIPLLPWKHGSEPCEHVFGWMCVISPRFTVLDARMMMPKIHAIVKNIMSGRMKIPSSEHMHSGYQ